MQLYSTTYVYGSFQMKMKSGLLFQRTYSMNPEKNMKMKDARPQEERKKKHICDRGGNFKERFE